MQRQKRRHCCEVEPLEARLLLYWGAPLDNGLVDVTIISDNYTDMAAFHSDAQKWVINEILAVEPYHSRSDQMDFHFIDNQQGLYNGVDANNFPIFDNALLNTIVAPSPIPTDVVVVLSNINQGGVTLSGREWGGGQVASVANLDLPYPDYTAAHEFGHSFAGLGDEYVYASGQGVTLDGQVHGNLLYGSPPAPAWANLVAPDEYFRGGTIPDAYRPSPKSLMSNQIYPYMDSVSIELVNEAMNKWAGPLTDTQSPTVSILSPKNGDSVSGVVVVQPSVSDNRGVTRTQLWVDGQLVRNCTEAPFDLSWKTGNVVPGVHQLQVLAFDAAGNVGRSPVVSINLTAGSDFDIISPQPGGVVGSTFRLDLGAWSGEIQDVAFFANGMPLVWHPVPNTDELSWYINAPPPGSYTMTAVATPVNNLAKYTASVPVTVPWNAGQLFSVDGIQPNAILGGTVPIVVQTGVLVATSVSLAVDGQTVAVATQAPFSLPLDTTRYTDGTHNYTIDIMGLNDSPETGMANFPFIVHNMKPVVSLSAPKNHARVGRGTLVAAGNTTDDLRITLVQLLVDDKVVATSKKARFTLKANLGRLSRGMHSAQVRAYDSAGSFGLSKSVSIRRA